MSAALDVLSNLAELFTWIGFGLGLPLLVILLIMKAAGGRWVETDAIVVDEGGSRLLRWMSTEGLHERPLATGGEVAATADSIRLYYRHSDPENIRFDRVGHGEKTLSLLSVLLLGLGLLGAIGSIVLLFLGA